MAVTEGLEEYVRRFHVRKRTVQGVEYLVMYKGVLRDYGSWYLRDARYGRDQGKGKRDAGAYRPGTTVKCRHWSSNRNNDCDTGLHVGTLNYALMFRRSIASGWALRLVELLVRPEDVVCVPRFTDGKIRCKRLIVVREVVKR